jgi:hypothetical protein
MADAIAALQVMAWLYPPLPLGPIATGDVDEDGRIGKPEAFFNLRKAATFAD